MPGDYQKLPNQMANYSPFFTPVEPPPIEHYNDAPVTNLTFSCELIPYLLALLEILTWNDRFTGSDDERSRAVSVFQELQAALMEVYCMSDPCCEIQAIEFQATFTVLHQLTPNGEMQISIDGGQTWVQDPKDPRLEFPQLPPLVQPGNLHTKCDAASNAIGDLKDIQSRCASLLETSVTAFELAIDIIAIIVDVVFFAGAGLPALIGILIGLTKAIADMTQSTYNGLFTEDVWDKTLCAMYCTIGDNGQFTPAQFTNLMNKLYADLDGGDNPLAVSANMRAFFRTMGVVGLNNICSAGSIYDADCSDCDCGCTNGWVVGTRFNSGAGDPIGDLVEETDAYVIIDSRWDGVDSEAIFITTTDSHVCCNMDLARTQWWNGTEWVTGGGPWTVTGSVECGHALTDWGFVGWAACVNSVELSYAKESPDDNHFRVKIPKSPC